MPTTENDGVCHSKLQFVDDVNSKDFLTKLLNAMYDDLPASRKKK